MKTPEGIAEEVREKCSHTNLHLVCESCVAAAIREGRWEVVEAATSLLDALLNTAPEKP